MPYDVFISHSSIDKPVADAAVAVLERSRIRCWVAPRDIMPGSDWGAAIIQGIRGSRLMLVIFSSHSNASEQVKREVERAVHQGIPIIPPRIENIQPTGSMELFLSTPHWLDAVSSPLEAHLEQLARTVHVILQGSEQQLPPPTPGPVWAPAPPSYQDTGQNPQWAPTATMTTGFPATTKPPFPLWLIAVIFGGVVALGGAVYVARSFASSGGFPSMFEPAGPKMTGVSFFESGSYPVVKPRRVYATRFATIGTRYITYEVTLQYPENKEESKAVLEAKWVKPDGTPETKQDQLLIFPPGTTTGSWAYGWGTQEGGYFRPGTYTVDFYLADKKRSERANSRSTMARLRPQNIFNPWTQGLARSCFSIRVPAGLSKSSAGTKPSSAAPQRVTSIGK